MNKLLIICGPTATGKTQLGVELARKFHGEIISADSRQVYRGMDIGTGKDLPVNSKFQIPNSKNLSPINDKLKVGYREKEGIPIWLVDIVNPDYVFNVGEYRELAKTVINHIWSHNKLPIVVGGTGLYIRSFLEPLDELSIPPNQKLRRQLADMPVWALQTKLQRKDLEKWKYMNHSDRLNPRRLVRAIEIVEWKKDHHFDSSSEPVMVSESKSSRLGTSDVPRSNNNMLLIGLTMNKEELFNKIDQRVEARVKEGIIAEIQSLLQNGYSWDLPSMSGMGYKEWKEYFVAESGKRKAFRSSEELTLAAIKQWKKNEHDYVKRQLTWFKKVRTIKWFDIVKPNWHEDVSTMVTTWYNFKHES